MRAFCPSNITFGSAFRSFGHHDCVRQRPGSACRRGGVSRRGHLPGGCESVAARQKCQLCMPPRSNRRNTNASSFWRRRRQVGPRPAHPSPRRRLPARGFGASAAARARHVGPPKSLAPCGIARQKHHRRSSRGSRNRPSASRNRAPSGLGRIHMAQRRVSGPTVAARPGCARRAARRWPNAAAPPTFRPVTPGVGLRSVARERATPLQPTKSRCPCGAS